MGWWTMKLFTRWWQLKYVLCSPRSLWKWSKFDKHIFQMGGSTPNQMKLLTKSTPLKKTCDDATMWGWKIIPMAIFLTWLAESCFCYPKSQENPVSFDATSQSSLDVFWGDFFTFYQGKPTSFGRLGVGTFFPSASKSRKSKIHKRTLW